MKYINHKLIGFVVTASMLASCVDKYDFDIPVEKPAEVENSEYLASFDVLKSYIGENSSFALAANLPAEEFMSQELAYSTLISNFNAVDINGSFAPADMVDDNGSEYDFGDMQTIAFLAGEAGVSLYGTTLCSNQNQRKAYYESLIAPVVTGEPETGITTLFDFNNVALGTTYNMTNGSEAKIVEDPAGESGRVLSVGTEANPAANSWAELYVRLPEGRTLGDYVTLTFDVIHINGKGIYGSGLRLLINGEEMSLSDGKGGNMSGSSVGANNKWARGVTIKLNDAAGPGCALPDNLKGLTSFTLCIGARSSEAVYCLDNISMNYEAMKSYSHTIDFEDDEIGKTYPTINPSDGTQRDQTVSVTTDPDGKNGKSLYVKVENQTKIFPKITVNLGGGITLGDCKAVSMDMRLNAGQYGDGMGIFINGTKANIGKGTSAFYYGCTNGSNEWKNVSISLVKEGTYTDAGQEIPTGVAEIPAEVADLSAFDFAIGSSSGEWDAYIDNIRFTWNEKQEVIEKTDEEKKEIFTEEMKKWIGGMVYAGVNETNSVKVWNIIGEPLDETQDENTFNWSEYLGAEDYARTAIQTARDTVKDAGVELQLFVSQTVSQLDNMAQMADRLIELVDKWEADNASRIDGYNILLHAICSKNADTQKANRQAVTALLERLAATGKIVRISDLSMMMQDVKGNFIEAGKLKTAEREEAADYMAFIMQEYRRIIPEAQQFGIALASMAESAGENLICPWTSDYNRNGMYEGIVNGLKDASETENDENE